MNEAIEHESGQSSLSRVTVAGGDASQLPHIVTVGRYRIGRVLQKISLLWSEKASFTHVAASFDEAVAQVQALNQRQPIDALVGAGASGAWVRERVDIPVSMVEVRGLDLLQALRQAKLQVSAEAPHVGLVSFEAPSPIVAQFDQLFGLGLVQMAYQGPHDAAACIQKLQAAGVGAVVAPGLISDLAEQAGMPSVLLYSEKSVHQALGDALLLARHKQVERDRHRRLETVIGQLQDGVVAVDEIGRIRALNARMAMLLGAEIQALHGRLLDEVAPVLNVAQVLQGDEGGEEVVQLAMRTLVLRRAPIWENGQLTGALLVCRDPAVIQSADRRLRANRSQRGAGVRWRLEDYVGESPATQRVRQLARQYATTEATVLILGESGTGKELLAQGMHRASRRAAQPFLAVNCAALSESLLESELFGYDDGAFTGARRGGKTGLIEAAHTGTLFLDEIGDMPLALQSRLLRVLQEREVLRVGSTTPVPVDVRVMAATHADLAAQVEKGRFRRDLYYRLAVLRLQTSPLRERDAADVELLARRRLASRLGLPEGLKDEPLPNSASHAGAHAALNALLQAMLTHAADYDWPGNVRELDNWVERLLACQAHLCNAQGLPDRARLAEVFVECAAPVANAGANNSSAVLRKNGLKESSREAERQRVQQVLQSVGGNQARACEILGISRATLWRRMKASA